MIKLTNYTTTQISMAFAGIFLAALIIASLGNLSVFKLLLYVIGSYVLSLEFAAILFAMRLPRKFYKRFQVEPFYSANVVILCLYSLNSVRTGAIVNLPLLLPVMAVVLVAIQFSYYKWVAETPTPARRPKSRAKR